MTAVLWRRGLFYSPLPSLVEGTDPLAGELKLIVQPLVAEEDALSGAASESKREDAPEDLKALVADFPSGSKRDAAKYLAHIKAHQELFDPAMKSNPSY